MGRRALRRLAGLALAPALAVGLAPTLARAEPDCTRIGPLAGTSLSTLVFDLPDTGATAEIWALLDYDVAPLTLPVRQTGLAQAALVMPLTLDLDTPETVPATLVALDVQGGLAWVCPDLVLEVAPPPAAPGGTGRLAARADALAARYETTFATGLPPELAGLAQVPAGLRLVARDLRAMAAEAGPDDLVRADAILGTVALALASGDRPAPRVRRQWRQALLAKFYPAQLALDGPGAIANVCPAHPWQLTEYIELGVRARTNTSADLQLMLTTSVTMFGVSARLANAGMTRNARVDQAIDRGVTALNTAQAMMTDYLAGMMPLNLERLEITHDPVIIPDDTPPENRLFRIHSATLHTRSDGWSPDKAALDTLVGLASLRTGGVGGMATGGTSRAWRSGAGNVAEATANATRLRRIADTVAAQQGLPGGPPQRVVDLMLHQAENAARQADEAARLARSADALDFGAAPAIGVIEGQATGQITGGLGASLSAPIGRIVSRCAVEMLRDADGSRSRHLIYDVVEGDGEVLQVGLGERIGFEPVGPGTRTARVRLNPALEYLPLTRQDILPEARVTVRVDQIGGRIDGLPPTVAPWSLHSLTAAVSGVTLDPPLVWEVDPPLPLAATGGRGVYTADLTIPEDIPPGTLITVRVRAEGDFISAATVAPVWVAVAQVREDEEDEDEEGFGCHLYDNSRVRRLAPGSLLAQRYVSSAMTSHTAVTSQFCPSGQHVIEVLGATGLDLLRPQRNADGVVAWGGAPVYRLAGLHRIEAMLAARGACLPMTAQGTVRDLLGEPGLIEAYALGTCDNFLLLTPDRGLILQRTHDFGGALQHWIIEHLDRQ